MKQARGLMRGDGSGSREYKQRVHMYIYVYILSSPSVVVSTLAMPLWVSNLKLGHQDLSRYLEGSMNAVAPVPAH